MKFARSWSLAAGVLGVGLVYGVLAQADSNGPSDSAPQPVEAVFEVTDAPFSPSDLPRLGLECVTAPACPQSACQAKACAAASSECKSQCDAACKSECKTACKSECKSECHAECKTACEPACKSEFFTAGGLPFPAIFKACIAPGEECACHEGCKCDKECACSKDKACAEDCACAKKQACGPAQVIITRQIHGVPASPEFHMPFSFAPFAAGVCQAACESQTACDCPAQGAYAAACANAPPGAVCQEGKCADVLCHGPQAMTVWSSPPPHPGQAMPFAYQVPLPPHPGQSTPFAFHAPLPPPSFAPHHSAPPMHHGMHDHLVHTMTENARLQAREEAWDAMQERFEQMAELAVENAELKAQVELASHKEKAWEQTAEALAKNAVLEAKLKAIEEREELVETLMKLTVEKAELAAHAEAMEAHHELHTEALGAMLEAKQELLAPLHEAMVENAALKTAVASQEETAALKARIAELEQELSKVAKAKKSEATATPAARTAQDSDDSSETK